MPKQFMGKFSAEFRIKVVLEAIKNQKTLAQLNQQFDVNMITISKWKAEALEHLPGLFKGNHSHTESKPSVKMEKLYGQIGQLKAENDFLKKVLGKN